MTSPILYEDFKSFSELSDYQNNQLDFSVPFVASEPVGELQWSFNPVNRTAHFNTYGNENRYGSIVALFNNLLLGDVIEAQCEVRRVSGTLPKILIQTINTYNKNAVPVQDRGIVKAIGNGEWENIKIRIIAGSELPVKIHFGLYSGDKGEFYIRNPRARVLKKSKPKSIQTKVLNNEIKTYEIRKSNNQWEIRGDFSNSGGSLIQANDTTLKVTYNEPFSGRAVSFATGDFYGTGNLYHPLVGTSNTQSIEIKFNDVARAIVPLENMPDGYHFSLVSIFQRIEDV